MTLSPPTRRPPATPTAMDARIHARRRAVAGDRARRRRRAVVSLAVVVALAAAGVGVAGSPLFDIAAVRVEGVADADHEAVRAAAGLRPGDNLLAADLRGAADKVQALPWVRVAEARRLPPSTVQLRVTPRLPVATVRLPGQAWLLDEEGVVVAGGARDGLVEIVAPNSVLPGADADRHALGAQVQDAAVRNALSVAMRLPEGLRALVRRYEAGSARDLRLHLDGGLVVRFGTAERIPSKARSTQLLLEQARQQAERADGDGGETLTITEIDVRAPDNPVLVPGVGPVVED